MSRTFYVTAYYSDNSRMADEARETRQANRRWIDSDARVAREVATTFLCILTAEDRANLVRVTVHDATLFPVQGPSRSSERANLLRVFDTEGFILMEYARQFQLAKHDGTLYRVFDPSPFNWIASKADGQAGTLIPAWNPGAERLWLTAYLLKHAYAVWNASYNEANHCCMLTEDEALDRVLDGATDFEAERELCLELLRGEPGEELWDWVERVLDHAKTHPGDARDDALVNELA